jgi:hypothetical protein
MIQMSPKPLWGSWAAQEVNAIAGDLHGSRFGNGMPVA